MNGDFLMRLIQACHSLNLGDQDRWKSVVRLDAILQDQLDANEFAWLIGKGYVFAERQVGRNQPERTLGVGMGRALRPGHPWVWLTPARVALADYLLRCYALVSRSIPQVDIWDHPGDPIPPPAFFLHPELTPHWENRTYDLWAGPIPIKSYSRHAPNQMDVLDAFQQQGWPRRTESPLQCDDYEIDPQQQLHDTIRDLNRTLKLRIIRFRGDGTGKGVLWEWSAPVGSRRGRRNPSRRRQKKT